MWSDNETKIDLLDFSHLLAVAKSVIETPDLMPTTIGIFGDWGSGKTSLMKMLEVDLMERSKENKELLCVSFNGWLFEGYEDAKTALMSTILAEIEKNRSPTSSEKFWKLLKSLRQRVSLMRLSLVIGKYAAGYYLAGQPGLATVAVSDLPGLLKSIAEKSQQLNEDQILKLVEDKVADKQEKTFLSLRDFHSDFTELLEAAEIKTLVVFIDDLDRCTPDTIIGTLEAIKLFLFAPQTVFVIGADEPLIRYAVRRRFPEIQGHKTDVGRDYLEKLIQFPIRIPPLSQVELELYIHLLFVEKAVSEEKLNQVRHLVIGQKPEHIYDASFARRAVQEALGTTDEQLLADIALASQIAPVLTQGLSGNPRQTKRFLNMLMMRLRMAEAREIKLRTKVLVKLMLLEYINLPVFRDLADLQATQEGKPAELSLAEKKLQQDLRAEASAQVSDETNETTKPENVSIANQDADNQYLKGWLADDWMKAWFMLEPALADEDLRPYFFFSRDKLTSFSASANRLSPHAQKVLADLTGSGDVVRRRGTKESESLNKAEVSAIFALLADKIHQRETLKGNETELDSLLRLVSAHTDLQGQLITLLRRIPESSLPIEISVNLEKVMSREALKEFAMSLLEQWSKSEIKPLATATQQTLDRLQRE